MLSVNSVHFVIEISGELIDTDASSPMALKQAEGDLVRPDRVRAIVTVSSFGTVTKVGFIDLEGEQYITNPFTQQWERLPSGLGWYLDPALLFDSEHGIDALLTGASWVYGTNEGSEAQAYYRLYGQLPGEQLWSLTFGQIGSGDVTVDVWVSREDYYVHRIELVELDSDPEEPTRWLIQLSAFDEPVDIEAPPIP